MLTVYTVEYLAQDGRLRDRYFDDFNTAAQFSRAQGSCPPVRRTYRKARSMANAMALVERDREE